MQATWQITSSAGVDMGTYQADSAAEALDAMARDAGYASQADAPVAFEGTVVEVEVEATSIVVVRETHSIGYRCAADLDAAEIDAAVRAQLAPAEIAAWQAACDAGRGPVADADVSGVRWVVTDEDWPSAAAAADAHLAAGIAYLSAQPHGDGLAYYEAGTRAWYAVSESDVAELGRRLAADPSAYSRWCADTESTNLTEAGYAGETASDGPETLAAAPEPVDGWIVPPACQGQIVTDAYGVDSDGTGWRRRYDASDRITRYARREEDVDDWDPVNEKPRGTWRWVEVQS